MPLRGTVPKSSDFGLNKPIFANPVYKMTRLLFNLVVSSRKFCRLRVVAAGKFCSLVINHETNSLPRSQPSMN